MKNISYIQGDVREPIGDGRKLICHIVNDEGKMGAGVAKALYEKWGEVRSKYYQWHKEGKNFKLGHIQGIKVTDDIAVINMIGQRGIREKDGVPPVRYGAIRTCLQKVAELALKYKTSVNIPYLMGCDLAGGNWIEVEKIINEELCNKDINVVIYDLFGKRKI